MNPIFPHTNALEGLFATQVGQPPLQNVSLGGKIFLRISGAWVALQAAVKVSGVYQNVDAYVRVGGTWVKTID